MKPLPSGQPARRSLEGRPDCRRVWGRRIRGQALVVQSTRPTTRYGDQSQDSGSHDPSRTDVPFHTVPIRLVPVAG